MCARARARVCVCVCVCVRACVCVCVILTLTIIQGHINLNHENNCSITPEIVQAMPITSLL